LGRDSDCKTGSRNEKLEMRNEKYQFHSFLPYKNILQGISSQAFGSMKKDLLLVDREKFAFFAKSVGIIGDIVCMRQIHSGTVRVVDDTSELRFPRTDGLVTNKKGLPLAVLTADCLPLMFYDPKKKVVAVAHAGYKGLLNQIIENTIERMVSEFASDPKDILVGIGPSIEMKCYEVGEELIEEFIKTFPTFKDMFENINDKYYLNLRSVALQCLRKEGILKENIEVMDICTKCDKNFYSYRRGDTFERFVSLISLV
jgi:YfiH family protein